MRFYDVSSSYFEGHTCPLARRGYSRDGKRGTLQITYGLLCDRAGRPVAVEVFSGETHDAATLASQIEKLKTRFTLASLVVVSDRGFVTKANLQLLRDTDGARWITALKAPQIKKLVRDGSLQLLLFDETNLAEISGLADYPGERLVVCRNPLVGAERTRKRVDLLDATRRDLDALKARVDAGTLIGTAQIALAVGATKNRYKMAKHLAIEITDTTLTYTTLTSKITDEAALDGLSILRTNIEPDTLPTRDVVRSYKQLEQVERAFRTLKGPDLHVRPIHHHLSHRVRSHVFLCTLAYYLTWHLREACTPLIFKDEHHPTATDPVAKAVRSDHATQKARTKTTTTARRKNRSAVVAKPWISRVVPSPALLVHVVGSVAVAGARDRLERLVPDAAAVRRRACKGRIKVRGAGADQPCRAVPGVLVHIEGGRRCPSCPSCPACRRRPRPVASRGGRGATPGPSERGG